MKLPKFLRRPIGPTAAARTMALQGVAQRKAKVRATCDAMRAEMGLAPVRWPE